MCSIDSPVIRLNMLGTNMIILNDIESTTEFFERRGLIYSNRYVCIPTVVVAGSEINSLKPANAHAQRSVSAVINPSST